MQPRPTKLSAADKARVEREAAAIVQKALLHIKIYYPFYGALAERLKVRQDWRHPTMYTDAVVLGYNPAFVVTESWAYILFVHAHEVTHCALGHPFRRKDRDPKDWNVAIDHVTNLALLKDPEFAKLWASDPDLQREGLADPRFVGMAAEQVYTIVHAERLKKEAEQKEKQRQQEEKKKQEQQSQPQPSQDEQQSQPPQESEAGEDEGEGASAPGSDGDEDGDEGDLGESATGAAGDCLDAGASGEEPSEEQSSDDEGEDDADGEEQDRKESSNESTDAEEGDGEDGEGDEESSDGDEEDGDGDASGDSDEPGDEDEDEDDAGGSSEAEVAPGKGGMDESQLAELEREWSQAVMTAQLAAGGDIEASMARAIGATQESPRSFKECVDDFAHTTCAMEDSWSRPNRRYSETYLPSRCAPGVKVMVLGVDTSGSISDVALALMQRAAQGILDDFGMKSMHVVYCDSRIRGSREFLPGEQVSLEDAKGGGGTSFHPVLRYALELEQAGEEVAGVIYLTDLEGDVRDPEDFAHLQILWVDIIADRPKWQQAHEPAGLGSVISVYQ